MNVIRPETVACRVEADLANKLRAAAEKDSRPLSQYLRNLLKAAMDRSPSNPQQAA